MGKKNPILKSAKKALPYAFGPVGLTFSALSSTSSSIKKSLAKNLKPYAYGGQTSLSTIKTIGKAVLGPQKGSYAEEKNPTAVDKERFNLLGKMMGESQYENANPVSKYQPTYGDKKTTYLSSPQTEKHIKEGLKDPNFFSSFYKDKKGVMRTAPHPYMAAEKGGNVLGNYSMSLGEDKKGKYVAYYDKWDLNPFKGKSDILDKTTTKLQVFMGIKPAEVYGRVYYYDNTKNKTK